MIGYMMYCAADTMGGSAGDGTEQQVMLQSNRSPPHCPIQTPKTAKTVRLLVHDRAPKAENTSSNSTAVAHPPLRYAVTLRTHSPVGSSMRPSFSRLR